MEPVEDSYSISAATAIIQNSVLRHKQGSRSSM